MNDSSSPLPTTQSSKTKLGKKLALLVVAAAAGWYFIKPSDPWNIAPQDVELPAPFKVIDAVTRVQELHDFPMDAADGEWSKLKAEWGGFAALYLEDLLQLGPVESDTTFSALLRFAQHPDIAATFDAIDTTSAPATGQAALQIQNSFKRFHSHFPLEPVPDLVWINSAFNFAVYPTPEFLVVGLDWFLGADHPIVKRLAPSVFPAYMRSRMETQYLSADALRGWLLVHFAQNHHHSETCAEELLFWGKVLFVLDCIAPELDDRLWMDWSEAEMTWALEHERTIWLELQPQSMLFEKDFGRYNRWFVEGPFTRAANIPQDSPDRLGAWMGYRMVADFMDDHPEMPLGELMEWNDPVPIIKAYRPDR